MLQYINGDAIPQLNEEEALDLLQTAKFFQIPRLLALCEAQIKVRLRKGDGVPARVFSKPVRDFASAALAGLCGH